jgi:hypothetical protein
MMGARNGHVMQDFGQAGLLGLQAAQQANQQRQKDALQKLQEQSLLMTLRQQQQNFADQQGARQALQDFYSRQGAPGVSPPAGGMPAGSVGADGFGPPVPSLPPSPAATPATSAPNTAVPTPTNTSALGIPPKTSLYKQYESIAQDLFSKGYVQQGQQYADLAEKLRPKLKDTKTLTQNGQRVTVNLYDDGSTEVVPYGPDKEKLHFADTGGAVQGLDQFTGAPVSAPIPKSLTPGESARLPIEQGQLDVARGNLGVNQQRLGIERGNQDIRRAEVDPLGFLGINKNGVVGQQGPRVDYSPTLSPQELSAAQADAQKSGYTQAPSVTGAVAGNVHGDDFLKALPESLAAQVKGLASGSIPFPSSFALKSPYWQGMISLVTQYDPSFDAVNYGARAKTRNAFTAGKEAQQANALNTVIGHLGQLSDAADSLNNTSIPIYNRVANFAARETGDPRINQFEITRKAVVDELTRVYRGTGGSEKDIQTWTQQINAASSPEQLHGAIAQVSGLLESKIQALTDQYQKGMGTTAQGLQLLTPHARDALDKMEQRAGGTTKASGSTPAGTDKVTGKPLYRRADGKLYFTP